MIVVIFEVGPILEKAERYFDFNGVFKVELEKVDGFISVERLQSLTAEGKDLSFSF